MNTDTAFGYMPIENFLWRSSLVCTVISSGEPKRFRNQIHGIARGTLAEQIPEQFNPDYLDRFLSIVFKETIQGFGLWKNKVLFFDKERREWTGYRNGQFTRFLVEVVGLLYNHTDYYKPDSWPDGSAFNLAQPISEGGATNVYDYSAQMDEFGIAISGANIRAILFKKLCNATWCSDIYNKENIHYLKGKKLLRVIESLLDDHSVTFTNGEIEVFDRYREQDLLLNPKIQIPE